MNAQKRAPLFAPNFSKSSHITRTYLGFLHWILPFSKMLRGQHLFTNHFINRTKEHFLLIFQANDTKVLSIRWELKIFRS